MFELQHNVISALYGIKGILDNHQANCNCESQKKLEKLQEPVARALAMMLHLKEVMRQDLSVKPERNYVSIRRIWARVEKLMRREFIFYPVQIHNRIPYNFPPIRCDRDDLFEIIYHLAKNSMQAMISKNPQLKKEMRLIIRAEIAFSACEDPLAILTLSDTGPGVCGDNIPRVFEPFFTTKSAEEGSGLGLYLTKRLVNRNKGKIRLSSYENCGTTFALEFPLARAGAKPQVNGRALQS